MKNKEKPIFRVLRFTEEELELVSQDDLKVLIEVDSKIKGTSQFINIEGKEDFGYII